MLLAQYFLMFIIYSVIGWITEVINFLVIEKKFVNRGFLIGPYCPIYGFGGLMITLFLTKYFDSPVTLFIMAIFICSILEYCTSYVMEKLFKARWWDYSNYKFNINGRICLETMIPFGLLGCLGIYVINPLIFNLFAVMSFNLINILVIIILTIYLIDNFISFKIITNFKASAINLIKKDNTEEITKKVKEILRTQSKLNKRLMEAFPSLKTSINNFVKKASK